MAIAPAVQESSRTHLTTAARQTPRARRITEMLLRLGDPV